MPRRALLTLEVTGVGWWVKSQESFTNDWERELERMSQCDASDGFEGFSNFERLLREPNAAERAEANLSWFGGEESPLNPRRNLCTGSQRLSECSCPCM